MHLELICVSDKERSGAEVGNFYAYEHKKNDHFCITY